MVIAFLFLVMLGLILFAHPLNGTVEYPTDPASQQRLQDRIGPVGAVYAGATGAAAQASAAAAATAAPVSYTHLDVYKRQPLLLAEIPVASCVP